MANQEVAKLMQAVMWRSGGESREATLSRSLGGADTGETGKKTPRHYNMGLVILEQHYNCIGRGHIIM